MLRTMFGVLLGIVGWIVIVTLLNFGLRAVLPGYQEAEPLFSFTLPMMAARLAEGAIATVAGGAVTRLIAPSSRAAPIALGVVLTALFIPVHISMWTKLPIWYHSAFLLTLLPLTLLGAGIVRRKARASAHA